jgi:hypothetical protein
MYSSELASQGQGVFPLAENRVELVPKSLLLDSLNGAYMHLGEYRYLVGLSLKFEHCW